MTVVTFTTDFGTVDGYVGAMKGVVLSLAPDAVLVDITHDIPRHDVAAGAFALAQAAPLYPPGTVHVAVVDPGVGGERADIVVEAGGAYFVGPDNGVLALAARGPRVAHEIARPDFRRVPVSPTFHGRDVFAQTAGKIARGSLLRDAGPLLEAIEELPGVRLTEGEQDAAVVVHIDAFGNLITSWAGDGLSGGRWRVECLGPGGDRHSFEVQAVRTYAEVAPGALLAYVGSAGVVEIAVREGSAAAVTRLARGDRLRFGRAP
jgi:S-adenosyl-L-methionine hydrolase (adenosine-forming)